MSNKETLVRNDGPRMFNRYFNLFFAVGISSMLGLFMCGNALALFVSSLGGSASFSGILGMLFAVMGILGRVLSGYLSDHMSRLKVMAAGCIIFAAASLMFAIFPLLWAIPIFRGFQGLGFAFLNTALSAALADVIPKGRLNEGIGIFSTSTALALAISGAVTFALVNGDDYSLVFIVISVMMLFTVILTFFARYDKNPQYAPAEENKPAAVEYHGINKWFEKSAVPASIGFFFLQSATSAIGTFGFLFADFKGYENPGYYLVFAAAGMILVRIVFGKTADRRGPLPMLVTGALCNAAAMLITALAIGEVPFFIAGALYGASQGFYMPTFNALAIRNVEPERRGVASSTYTMAFDISGGIAPVLWGLVIDGMGYTAMFSCAALFCLISLAFCVFFFRRKKLRVMDDAAAVRSPS